MHKIANNVQFSFFPAAFFFFQLHREAVGS